MPGSAEALDKAVLRAQALSRRDALAPEERAAASAAIAGRTNLVLKPLLPACLALYWPIGSECDPRPLIAEAVAAGAELALPAIVDSATIYFRRYGPGDPLRRAGFGTSEPLSGAPLVDPEVIVLPLVAFDRAGTRLGYGRGYYDRAVAALRREGRQPRLIGVAFAAQEVDVIPGEPHDIRLGWLVTEKETLVFPDLKD